MRRIGGGGLAGVLGGRAVGGGWVLRLLLGSVGWLLGWVRLLLGRVLRRLGRVLRLLLLGRIGLGLGRIGLGLRRIGWLLGWILGLGGRRGLGRVLLGSRSRVG